MFEVVLSDFVNSVRMVATATQNFAQLKHEGAKLSALNVNYAASRYWAEQMLKSLGIIQVASASLGLLASEASSRQASELFQNALEEAKDDNIVISGERFHRTLTHLSQINVGLKDELQGRIALVLSLKDASYYTPAEPLFGSDVFNAFASANDDVVESGKCLAVGRGTACVMHLMRVAEVALKGLGKSLGVGPQNDWGSYLRKIEEELSKRAKTAGARTPVEQFYAEAATRFDHLRRAWRNPSMHVDRSYSPERAEEIFLALKSFVRHLADNKISE